MVNGSKQEVRARRAENEAHHVGHGHCARAYVTMRNHGGNGTTSLRPRLSPSAFLRMISVDSDFFYYI
eukprot:COSAG06_NODE_3819_length_4875_cov_7.735553_1_plen_68_part_00